MHQDITIILPILNREGPDVNMARLLSGFASIDNLDSRDIINMNWGRGKLGKRKLMENRTKVLCSFCSRNGSNELGLGGASSSDSLCLGTVSNSNFVKGKSVTGSGATVAEIIGMSSVNISSELKGEWREGKGRREGSRDRLKEVPGGKEGSRVRRVKWIPQCLVRQR
ncbi:hypothetical protein IV203_001009 [Nitzschia inconspicua]|uniref:Uncharacterized protein n=1 Tax=Nitzschia inconspicua TaxID=303405 RepID=A0A9K3PR87_9STRA|nr:hypothetical protein IV203_001009 [Nitzschia inconspicua]